MLLAVTPRPVSGPGPRGQRDQGVGGVLHLVEMDGGRGVPVLHQSVRLWGGGAAWEVGVTLVVHHRNLRVLLWLNTGIDIVTKI